MVSIQVKARTGLDGVLHIDLPTGYPDSEVEGCLMINPVAPRGALEHENAAGWPEGFFDTTAGRWNGELERGNPGYFEARDWQE